MRIVEGLYRWLTNDRNEVAPAVLAACAVVVMVLVYGNANAAANGETFPLLYWWWHVWVCGG